MKKLMIQQSIQDNNNHRKFSIILHRVGVVLLEKKGVKENRTNSFISWINKNNFAHEK